jgi:hypothetical protein
MPPYFAGDTLLFLLFSGAAHTFDAPLDCKPFHAPCLCTILKRTKAERTTRVLNTIR